MANAAQKRAIQVLLDAVSVMGDPTEATDASDGVNRSLLALQALPDTGVVKVVAGPDGQVTVTLEDLLIPVIITMRILTGLGAALQNITVEDQVAQLREWWDTSPDTPAST